MIARTVCLQNAGFLYEYQEIVAYHHLLHYHFRQH